MKTPVHKISIANKFGVPFDIINIGDDKNQTLGVESIVINRTKDDINEECVITIASKYDVNGVEEIADGSGDLKLTNQLPTNDDVIFNRSDFRSRFGHFDYEVGDMVFVRFAYNEEIGSLGESYFGFIKSAKSINDKKVVITLQNHSYLMKKILYNFSQKELFIKDLMFKLTEDYNKKFDEIYGPVIAELRRLGNNDLALEFETFGFIQYNDSLVNVDYTIKNFRAENKTSIDIYQFLVDTYFTRSSFFQVPGGNTHYIGGFFNLFQISEISFLPQDLKNFLDFNFVFKNYDLYYETIGLNDEFILDEIRKQGNELNAENSFTQVILNKNLTWQEARDVIVRINFKVIDRNNQVTESSYGDDGGESKTVVYFEPKTEAELKALSEEYVGDLKYTGYKKGSSITTYGTPSVSVFDEIYVVDVFQNQSETTENPYRLVIQKYLVDNVNINYSSNGGLRQTITFGSLLSTNVKVESGIDNNIVFKAQTDRFVETSTGKSPADSQPTTFKQDSTDYQLLSQIDNDIENIIGHTETLTTLNARFFTLEGELFNAEPRGYFTKTEGVPVGVEFTGRGLGVNEFFSSSESTAGTREKQNEVSDVVLQIRTVNLPSARSFIVSSQELIDEAVSRGLNVADKQARQTQAKLDAAPVTLESERVLNFNNEI